MLHGVLLLDKRMGWTSHDVVAWSRRRVSQKRIGHTGTLDPAATGLLPLCLGDATRLAEYLTGHDKTYEAEIMLGYVSNTYDLDGEVQADTQATSISAKQIEFILQKFRGVIQQQAPAYSAIMVQGKRLYQLARAGIEVELPVREVIINSLDNLNPQKEMYDPGSSLKLRVTCSKGTYIRSLAHDIGQELGCGALLKSLKRTQSGLFKLEDAYSMEQVEAISEFGEVMLKELIFPLTTAHIGLPWVSIDDQEYARLKNGLAIGLDSSRIKSWETLNMAQPEIITLYGQRVAAITSLKETQSECQLKPHKVFAEELILEGVI